jgi:hypothetical protein
MKYLIVKGFLGFGDRLESLKMCVAYALAYNLQIYVDWRDSMWSHETEDFYTYFNLLMPSFKLSDLPEDATYHPPYWKGHLDEQVTNSFMVARHNDNLNLNVLDKPYDADVIVYTCTGARLLYPDSTFFGNVFRVIDPRILNKVRQHSQAYPLQTSWGIHIRGTDRLKSNKRMFNIQGMVLRLVTNGGMNKAHMVVVSDDKENAQIIKNYYPNAYMVSSFTMDTSKGIHNLSKEELTITKDILNVDMLIDFFVLAKCERVYTTVKDSRYAQEAIRLHPVVDKILS